MVTPAVDVADTRKLDAETRYKLVTLPVETRPDREFASVLRAERRWPPSPSPRGAPSSASRSVRSTSPSSRSAHRRGPSNRSPHATERWSPATRSPSSRRPKPSARSNSVRARETAAGGPSAAGGVHVTPEEQVDATTPVTDGTSEDTESSSAPADSSEPTPTGSDETGPGAVADRSDADAPGIQTLEADEDGEPPADPTREDLETLAETDLDDLTGTDVTLDGSKDDGESDGEPTDDGGHRGRGGADGGDTVDKETASDDTEDDSTSGDGPVPSSDDANAADTDDGDWSVVVDQRRDEDDRSQSRSDGTGRARRPAPSAERSLSLAAVFLVCTGGSSRRSPRRPGTRRSK
ncbi:hypothetical protein BRC79_02950 [Halobacteriales archaeon QH_8_67_27]|nr:MAG: hypothetical protein BRC79_02950 [Halobacteriales archaeon QH_8_67_27]